MLVRHQLIILHSVPMEVCAVFYTVSFVLELTCWSISLDYLYHVYQKLLDTIGLTTKQLDDASLREFNTGMYLF